MPMLGSKLNSIRLILYIFVKNNIFAADKIWGSIFGCFGIDFGSQMELKWEREWCESGIKNG